MAQYSDYLKYLQHVDEITLNDIKMREEAVSRELQEALSQRDKKIEKMQQDQAALLGLVNAENESKLQNLKAKYETEAKQMEEIFRNEFDKVLADKKKLKADSDAAIASLREQYDSERASYEERLDEAERRLMAGHQESDARHNAEIEKLNQAYGQKMAEINAAMEAQAQERQAEIEHLKNAYEERLAASEQQLANARQQLESRRKAENDGAKADSDARIAALQAELAAVRKEWTSEKQRLESQLQQAQNVKPAASSEELNQLKKSYEEERAQHQKEIAALKAQLDDSEGSDDRIASLTGKCKRLRVVASVLGVLLLMSLGAAGYALINKPEAEAASEDSTSDDEYYAAQPYIPVKPDRIIDTVYVDREVIVQAEGSEKVVYKDNPNDKKEIENLKAQVKEKEKTSKMWQDKYNDLVSRMNH